MSAEDRKALRALRVETYAGLSRAARVARCRGCKEHVWRGLDDEVCAVEVDCDLRPLDPLAEVAALLEGLETYDVHRRGSRLEIDPRGAENITARAADSVPGEDVVVAHRCGRVVVSTATTRLPVMRRRNEPLPILPPF